MHVEPPNVIAPMFNTFTPLEEGSLKTRLMSLAKRCDIDVDSIYADPLRS